MSRRLLAALAFAVLPAAPASAQTLGIDMFKPVSMDQTVTWLRGQVQPGAQVTQQLVQPAAQAMRTQFQASGDIVSRTFSAALQRSRDASRPDAVPIPDDVRAALTPFFSEEVLDSVRFKIGDTSAGGLAGFAIRNGNAAAVTLIDTVIFKEDRYAKDVGLWAHELGHVEQFRKWGVGGFATRYAFNWGDVEAQAEARSQEYLAWRHARKEASRAGQ